MFLFWEIHAEVLGVKGPDICNVLSNWLAKIYVWACREEGEKKKMYPNVSW